MASTGSNVTLPMLQEMKREGKKIVAIVAWDTQIAAIADRAGVEMVVVGDSVGVNLWGHNNPLEVTLDEIIVVGKAVRRGVKRALVCCDVPFGPIQEGARERAQGGGPDRQGDRRRSPQGRRRRAIFRRPCAAIVRAGIPVMGAVRHHAADRAAIRHSL